MVKEWVCVATCFSQCVSQYAPQCLSQCLQVPPAIKSMDSSSIRFIEPSRPALSTSKKCKHYLVPIQISDSKFSDLTFHHHLTAPYQQRSTLFAFYGPPAMPPPASAYPGHGCKKNTPGLARRQKNRNFVSSGQPGCARARPKGSGRHPPARHPPTGMYFRFNTSQP